MTKSSASNDSSESKPPAFDYRLVKGDYGNGKDVGVVKIRMDHLSQDHHWIQFPNGDWRSFYAYRTIDEPSHDEMIAFDMAPSLRVSYRPFARFCHHTNEAFTMVACLMLLFLLFVGGAELTGQHYFDWSLYATSIGFWMTRVSFILFWFFLACAVVTIAGEMRYKGRTTRDEHPWHWEMLKREKERKGDGWF